MGLKDLFVKKNKEEVVTKEEYERLVKQAQDEEFKSSRFEVIVQYLNTFNTTKHKNKESYLLSLVGRLDKDINYDGDSFEKRRKVKKDEIEKFNDFIFNLTEEEVNENIFLYFARSFYLLIKSDVILPIIEIKSVANEEHKNFGHKSCFSLSNEITNIIPDNVPLTKQFKSVDGTMVSENILEEDLIDTYQSYNAFVNVIKKMFIDIYSLVLWNELITDKLPVSVKAVKLEVDNCSITILYSLEDNIGVKKSYFIDTRVAKMIGDKCGIPFDDMIKMTPNELSLEFENTQNKVLKK